MSNFRAKASEIHAAGVAERGNFEPHGIPLRMYNYWLRMSTSDKALDIRAGRRRENFCHFWRVVAIWAPLFFVCDKIEDFATSRVGQVILAVGIVAALFLGGALSHGFLMFLCIMGGILLGAALVVSIGFGLAFLHDKYWNSDWNDMTGKILGTTALTAVVLAGLTVLVIGTIQEGWIVPATVFGAVAAVAAFVFGMGALSDYLSGKRALAREAESQRIHNMTAEEYAEYRAPREPGKIAKFFSGVGDFIVLAFQVVRVKKWKICPMVTIEQ